MPFRLIAADLDDTLLDSNSRISLRNREAIRQAVARGVRFLIVTGRMFKTSVSYLDDLGLDGDCPLINFHGALVKRARSGEVLLHQPIANQIAIEVVEEAEKVGCHISIFIEEDLYIREENEYSRYYSQLSSVEMQPVGSLSDFLKNSGSSPSKMSIIRWDSTLDDVESRLRLLFERQLSILQSRPYFLEITDRLATKGQTLRWYTEREGIRLAEVMAFGDGPNDLDMLSFAGLGVAVANARPEIREAADLVTDSNDDDGVAAVIERYILERG